MMRIGSTVLALMLGTHAAHAFCGFYVSGSGEKMVNDATQVVLMRDGTRTVLSMQNDYKGPLEDFAMVIPVPVVLKEQHVKTLPKLVFQHVESLGSPRLVEYWEQDPCAIQPPADLAPPAPGMERQKLAEGRAVPAKDGVKIEAKFEVAEYKILILSATDSTGLERWLASNRYKIPAGAEPLLRPYVEGGSKFFVAKVDPKKVKLEGGRAALSPLRFHYDSDDFTLPIRLGMANSSGKQDLIVNIISVDKRFEAANYKNVFIPTNFDVKEVVKTRFAEFYAALFDKTLEANPGAVVTEYAWTAVQNYHCDPCTDGDVDYNDLVTLGADVIGGRMLSGNFVLTRLHARYGKSDMKDDLRFREGKPVTGGREVWTEQGLETDAVPAAESYFQARYAIRHRWTGPVKCSTPHRGIWGGPPSGTYQQPIAAKRTAFAPRGKLELAAVIDNLRVPVKPKPAGGGGFAKPPGGAQLMSFSLGAAAAALALSVVVLARRRRRR
jgi:hypothetical protein